MLFECHWNQNKSFHWFQYDLLLTFLVQVFLSLFSLLSKKLQKSYLK